MTNEERDLIARFIARVGGAPQTGAFLGGGSVPATQQQLPPIDREADAFIGQQFQQYPEARYRITQTAVVTEAALAEAQNRIKRLEWELEQTKNAAQQAFVQQGQQQQAQPAAQPQQSGGFFSSIFGSGQQQRPGYAPQPQQAQPMGQPVWGNNYQPTTPPPQPQYAPGYQPGMFQRGGSGFLGSALTTAAGVAGGMVVGNALMGMFEGHHGGDSFGGSGGFGAGGFGGADVGGASPWGAAAGGAAAGGGVDAGGNPFDGGGVLPTSDPTAGFGSSDTAYNDPFAGAPAPDSGWDQASSGFDDNSGGGFGGGGFDDNNA